MTRCWTIDLQTYDDGTIATIFKTRANDSEADHRFFYARFDGSAWTSTYLGKAGSKMYYSEEDYVGLGALHPNHADIIYISTPFDPRDDTDLKVREIFKGVTADQGATWSWTPVTQNSVRDNFRPIVPDWDKNNTALLWWRGTYHTAQSFDAAIVGILDCPSESLGLMSYTDASASNTTLADGSPLTATGPDANQGAADNQWHERTGFGNNGSVLTSAETGAENAPMLKTNISVPDEGIYDIWINFWANPDYDWRIKAGLSVNTLQIFRQMACKQVENGEHNTPLILSGNGNTYLYQAYLGRIRDPANNTFGVFVDDEAIQVGTSATSVGDIARTWYDGISYAGLDTFATTNTIKSKEITPWFSLGQNHPNPFNQITMIDFSLQKDAHINLKVYNPVGQEIITLVKQDMPAGHHSVNWNAQNLPSGVYFYEIRIDDFSKMFRMILLK
jgi:hypothetical protein